MFLIVKCIHSQIALAIGFLIVVGLSLMLFCCSIIWNSRPVNSLPLSCKQNDGNGYLASQVFSNFCATWPASPESYLTNSVKLVAISIIVRALKVLMFLSLIKISHGPIISTATVPQGFSMICLTGNCPYFWLGDL